MKNVLKGWITPNTVSTEEKDDKILVPESAGNLVMDDVIDEMVREDTGLRRETMVHAVDLYQRTLTRLSLNGYSINTGMFYMSPQFKGVITDGVWDEKVNSIYINFQQGKMLREGSADTSVKILGVKQETAYILGSEDTATRATDGSATAGRTFRMKGKKIKVAGDDLKKETKLSNDMIVQNNPSEVIVLLPADLAEGTYELRIVTQFSFGAVLLKAPRTLAKQFIIGSGGDVEDPTT